MIQKEDIAQLAGQFKGVRNVLIALGDENRQHLILEMMQMGSCQGVRVNEITARTHLSRPAVSHHLQILKAAGLIQCRRQGTKNYYSFASDPKAMDDVIAMLYRAKALIAQLPEKPAEE